MPLRAAFIGFPNGCNYERWLPKGEGKDYKLNETFAPMEDLKGRFQIVTGLAHDTAKDWGDGPGDHARSGASFLTGCHAWKTEGGEAPARHLGRSGRRPAGRAPDPDRLARARTEAGRLYGSCDTGYACAYQYNLSWASETLPLPPSRTRGPSSSGSSAAGARTGAAAKARIERRKSVLDFVREDAKDLTRDLGRTDRQKVEEYLAGVRRIEEQIQKYERFRTPTGREAARPASRTTTPSTWP